MQDFGIQSRSGIFGKLTIRTRPPVYAHLRPGLVPESTRAR